MVDQREARIAQRELRRGYIRMTASPPPGTGFIGFVPELPAGYKPLTSPLGETMPAANNGDTAED